jgi:1,4-dihydroxy-2-naphthoate polyprenyltransferase
MSLSIATGASEPPRASVPPTLKTWVLAIRPKTLTAAAVPVLVGTGLAFGEGHGRMLPALAALFGALLIQIGTNLTNDYYDFKKGADTSERLGPTRVTQAGLIAPGTVLMSALIAFGLAVVIGIYLVAVGGWPIVVIGALSVLSGFAYTGGPFPLGYNGLGDLFVFVFFGFVAVIGTYYVQALTVSDAAWLASIPVGALGTAILVVNNLRDAATDAKCGKRTLIVRLGTTAGRVEYLALLALAFATPLVLWATGTTGPLVLIALLALPAILPPARRVLRESGSALNPALGETARVQMIFGVLFALGLWRG